MKILEKKGEKLKNNEGFIQPPFFLKMGAGFTLIEILISVTIFVFITVAIYSVHALSQRAYRESETAIEITQNGRVILDRMAREIRQAKAIAMEMPEEQAEAANEIIFQDGHLVPAFTEGQVQGAGVKTIVLELSASDKNGYYKNMFIMAVNPANGETQTKKIVNYDGETRTAQLEEEWQTLPVGWDYQIDSSYYYVRYYRNDQDEVWKQVFAYCFTGAGENCIHPLVFVAWNSASSKQEIILEEKIVGQYASEMEFWGRRLINVLLVLSKNGKTLNFETSIAGRNL